VGHGALSRRPPGSHCVFEAGDCTKIAEQNGDRFIFFEAKQKRQGSTGFR
jgi:hypothetical protein